MKLLTLFTLIITATSSFADVAEKKADPAKIKAIQKIYEATNAAITAMEKSADTAKASDITVDIYKKNALNRSWEAVGKYNITYKSYYKHNPVNAQDSVLKLTRTVESTGKNHEEFYFNEKKQLVFYYQKSDTPDLEIERRFYFDGDKAIRIIVPNETRDEYTDGDKEIAANIIFRSKVLRQKFDLDYQEP